MFSASSGMDPEMDLEYYIYLNNKAMPGSERIDCYFERSSTVGTLTAQLVKNPPAM